MHRARYTASADILNIVGGVQRWEETEVADTLTIFDNTDARAPILIIQEATDGNLQGFRESPTG